MNKINSKRMKRLIGLNGMMLMALDVLISSCGGKKSSNFVSSKTG